jgi:hypothetical protein
MTDKEERAASYNDRGTAENRLLIDYYIFSESLRDLDLLATEYWLRTGLNEQPNFCMCPDTDMLQLIALISQPQLIINFVSLGHRISVSL